MSVLADKAQKAQREWDATTRQFCEKGRKIGELELKVRLLIDDSVAASGLKKQ